MTADLLPMAYFMAGLAVAGGFSHLSLAGWPWIILWSMGAMTIIICAKIN
jgi:hypothetical protein